MKSSTTIFIDGTAQNIFLETPDCMSDTVREKILSAITEAAVEANNKDGEERVFDHWDSECFTKIDKNEVRVGDYVYSNTGFFDEIIKISVRYDSKTGKPYKIGKLEDNDGYTFCIDDHKIIKGPKRFIIYGYYRLNPGIVISVNK